jgi:hypothetical protein
MQLESLANELLLNLFEFFNGVHLIRTFTGLNARFDNLLLIHFQSNSLVFDQYQKQILKLFVNNIFHHWPIESAHFVFPMMRKLHN